MALATVETVSAQAASTRLANCGACLTRNCALAGNADSPVQVCNSYRQANCYFCSKSDCALNGTADSPVLACDSFATLAIA